MRTVHGIAQSGLDVAATRLGVSAHHVANALTPGFLPGRVTSEDLPGGGVAARVERPGDAEAEARADRALLAPSRTDLVAEVVAQSQAARLYQASLATLRTADELLDAALRLKP